jgi:SAM-dependent methyltransferase
MAAQDRVRWDERYAALGAVPRHDIGAPPRFVAHAHLFPSSGRALELACGTGRVVAWLASRGLEVWAVDVSPVAIGLAQDLVGRAGLDQRCHLATADLDEGIPAGPSVDVVVCNMFRDPRLDDAIVQRLLPGGLLAIAALSEVGVGPGRYRARRGELLDAFDMLEVIESGEQNGEAWLLGRRA